MKKSWIVSSILIGCAIFTAGIAFSLLGHDKQPDYSKTPVLFVHGHGLDAKNWNRMIEIFMQGNYAEEYLLAVQIQPNRMANINAAKEFLHPAMKKLLQQSQQAARLSGKKDIHIDKINIVSHSMGAISSRWLANKIAPERINALIGIAPANHGTNALCSHTDPGGREMCPAFAQNVTESFVQVELNGTVDHPIDETPYGIGIDRLTASRVAPDQSKAIFYFTIRIEPDKWIKPEHSSLLDGAGGANPVVSEHMTETTPGNYLFTAIDVNGARIDHENLLEDERLIRFVSQLLSASQAPHKLTDNL